MKIKVERKKFDAFIRQFVTKGKLRVAGSDTYNINFAYIVAEKGVISVSGRKKNSKIMVRATLDGEILEEGKFQITDIKSFMEELKGLTGKFYTFTFGEIIHVSCGKKYDFPYHVSPADAALLTKLLKWDKSHYKEKDVVKFDSGGKTYEFTKWFTIKEASQLNTLSSLLFNRTKVEFFKIITDSTMKIVADNPTDKRTYYDDEFDGVEIFNPKEFELGADIFPLFNSLSGPATFYVYLTSKGSTVIWCENNGLEWQITYKV